MASSASASASAPDLNLTLLPYPVKTEPKTEPPDPISPCPVLGPVEPLAAQPASPCPDDEAALFDEYCRLAQLFISSLSSSSRAVVPTAAPSPSFTELTTPSPPQKKNKKPPRPPRSAEMVRVSPMGPRDRAHFHDLVRRARATFESLRLLLLRRYGSGTAVAGILRCRADLKAAALMGDCNIWLNRDKRIIGAIPGAEVGDVFFFRIELCVVGLHGQPQAGIDHVPASRSATGEPIATSIIVSGGYEDDEDCGDVIIYTGHGGRDRNHHKMSGNQKLEGGNLALERSMHYGIEIRVIRGFKADISPSNKVYIYDGLYKVIEWWQDMGKSGFGVCKYKLVRVTGQDPMGTHIVRISQDLKSNPLSVRPKGYLSMDMSMGKENLPVSVFNDIDDDRDPLLFDYLPRPIYPQPVYMPKGMTVGGGCDCLKGCSVDCYCAKLNGGEFAYDESGILLRGKPVVYECGPYCGCPPSCINRVSQKGLNSRLEVFRSQETGWGVRSFDLIRAGSFVCEFSGIVLTKQQSEIVSVDGGSLVSASRFPQRWVEWGDLSDVLPDYTPPSYPPLPQLGFSLDVSRMRNVGCYLSHSCSPNVFIQFVLYDHYNALYPHLMVFAMENIPPLRELSIDYGIVEEWVGRLTMS